MLSLGLGVWSSKLLVISEKNEIIQSFALASWPCQHAAQGHGLTALCDP